MKPKIKLAFRDFWRPFDPSGSYFWKLLSPHYELELSDDPDFLIYSCFGVEHRQFRCLRIFYTGENWRPDFQTADYAFSFDYNDHPNHYRLPLHGLYFDPRALIKPESAGGDREVIVDAERLLAEKTGFCNFVYSNRRCKPRNRFFEQLSKYKRVDSGGKVFNNLGGRVPDKLAFIRKYKFTIAFENGSHPGYTTEKIAEPMREYSLPIYWGDPLVARVFNPRSFVNFYDHGDVDALIDRVIELDRNDDQYCAMLRQPWYHDNRVPACVDPANVLAAFDRIFNTPREPIALRAAPKKYWFFDRPAKPYANLNKKRPLRAISRKLRQIIRPKKVLPLLES